MAIQIRRGTDSGWESNNSNIVAGEPAITTDTGRFFVGTDTGEFVEMVNIDTIAEAFDSSVTYAVGDYCTYGGKLYKFTSAHSGAWSSGDVSEVTIDAEIALKADANDIPSPSNANPQMDGTASAGVSGDYSRADHVHPSDTSRASASDIYSIASEMTTFVEKKTTVAMATNFSDIDKEYKTYTGRYFSTDGTFGSNASWNSYAFVVPYNGFKIKTNAQRVCIANEYPNTDAGTIDIDTVLKNGTDAYSEITLQNKGDIIVISVGTATKLFVLTTAPNPTEIDTLFVKKEHDRFAMASVSDLGVSSVGNELLNITKVPNTLASATTAGYGANSSYTSWYFRVPVPSLTIKCTNGFRAVIGYSQPSDTSQTSNLKTLLYQYAAGIVETFTASYGDWVIISCANTSGEIDIQTDYMNRFELPTLRLGFRQSNSFYKYVVDAYGKYLYIYYKSGNKYVRWELHNVPAPATNSDTWQIGKVYGYDENLENEVELVASGEFELAFKEHGAADFCGGNNHGDETTDSFVLFIDGKQITDLTVSTNDYVAFNRIDAIEIATLNRCDTPLEDILKHQKVWSFENGTVKVKQSLQFLETLQVDGMLICMFAANRSSFKYGVRQGKVGIETMTDNSYTVVRTKINDMFYEMYGDNVTAKIKANSFNEDSDSGLWINPTSVLNKLYFTYWEASNSTYPQSVPANTVLHWESEYDVAYN